ncbi:MAG: hypothetical protein ACRECR_00575 [Thermoplasmata archaeon]
MSAALPAIRRSPEDENDELIVSKKGFAELKRGAEARERENERLRR